MARIIALTFNGNGAFRADLPARDLDAGDIDRLGADKVELAVGSGLYTPVFEADEEEEPSEGDMTVAELKSALEAAGLETSGKKADLVERLAAHHEAQAEAAAAAADQADEADQAATEVSNG